MNTETLNLMSFLNQSPTAFQSVEQMRGFLIENKFQELNESNTWNIHPKSKYFITKNNSSIIAFETPECFPIGFMIMASHTDSPMLKLKENSTSINNEYLRLNTEVYGSTIYSSWLDRPLTLAGRIIVKNDNRFVSKSFMIDKDLLMIPNVAIHLNRNVNSGYNYNPAIDLLPILGCGNSTDFKQLIASYANVNLDDIVGWDLYVVNHMKATTLGIDDEYFASPRIDNLMCAFCTLKGFLTSKQTKAIKVYYSADNEETGSQTKQGAGSSYLRDVLTRVCTSMNLDIRQLLPSSMMVSADNGHAIHPNHPELSDQQNSPKINQGIVIKWNASQKYATDSLSCAIFQDICKKYHIPYQTYSNRSDILGGSTLGSIANTKLPILTVDIGMAQLAMHSSYETAGVKDISYLINASEKFYGSYLEFHNDGNVSINEM